ncbi:MAG: hypothetical protein ABEJ58_07755 [Halodesulfurarchaeum sp.]
MADVNRGVSTVVGYVLNVGVATILITGLLFGATGLVSDQRERAVRSELEVVGNRIASDLQTADTLLRASDGGRVHVESSLPTHVAGQQYRIEIRSDGDGTTVVLRMSDPAVTVVVPVNTSVGVSETTLTGGPIVIEGSDTGPLEVKDG